MPLFINGKDQYKRSFDTFSWICQVHRHYRRSRVRLRTAGAVESSRAVGCWLQAHMCTCKRRNSNIYVDPHLWAQWLRSYLQQVRSLMHSLLWLMKSDLTLRHSLSRFGFLGRRGDRWSRGKENKKTIALHLLLLYWHGLLEWITKATLHDGAVQIIFQCIFKPCKWN